MAWIDNKTPGVIYASGTNEAIQMKNYKKIAQDADLRTEECLKEMSKGAMGVFKDRMYPVVFKEIFIDMLK